MTIHEQAALLRAKMLSADRLLCYERLGVVLSLLIANHLDDSPMADRIEDEMEVYWLALEEADREQLRQARAFIPGGS